MTIEPFLADDVALFLNLATSEGWVAEQWEFDFLLGTFSQGCFVARTAAGESVGYVTSLRHDSSGWIGNLIVAPQFRGSGVGKRLFVHALDALQADGVETFWLTASRDGQRLYEKYGFQRIDTISRWIGSGCMEQVPRFPGSSTCGVDAVMEMIDCQTWGDRRLALLAATTGRGKLLMVDCGYAVIQPCGEAIQLGPFSALDSGTAERIFDSAFQEVGFGTKLYLDVPVANGAATQMLHRRKLRIGGTTELMYAGRRPEYRPELLYGLATMGSCG